MTKVYLADLTHTTITISNDSFPLNVGNVVAYTKQLFPELEIRLFKYPETLYQAIQESPPDVLGLSNYPWNLDLNRSFFRYIKGLHPKVITVMGGPNISYIRNDQQAMLGGMKDILDFYIMQEGESGFVSLMTRAIDCGFDLKKMQQDSLAGALFIGADGVLAPFELIERSRNLDDYPSPYLTGVLDSFFDGKLSPMIETHRGCPYACTYCHEGHANYNKVNRYSTDRILAELDYIAEHVGKSVKNILIADPNFGMYTRDVEIAEKLSDLNKKTGYPLTLFATTAKNRKDNLRLVSHALGGVSMPVWMSVQSMNDDTLGMIKRKNIRINDMFSAQQDLSEKGANTRSELIIPLPKETFQTHIDGLAVLINMGINQIICYQLMLVNGSEMRDHDAVGKLSQFETRYRVLPRSFTTMDDLGLSIETEEIVVATQDFSFDNYLRARSLHLVVTVFYNCGTFQGFFRHVREEGIKMESFLLALLDKARSHPQLKQEFESFEKDTKRELFEDEDTLRRYYGSTEKYQQLVNGSDGANLLQKYSARLYMRYMAALAEVLQGAVIDVLGDSEDQKSSVDSLFNWYSLLYKRFLDADRCEKKDTLVSAFDIPGWLNSGGALSDYKVAKSTSYQFFSPEDQFTEMESYFKRYGRSEQAFGKIQSRLWISSMARNTKQV